jgi:hypothetical protein
VCSHSPIAAGSSPTASTALAIIVTMPYAATASSSMNSLSDDNSKNRRANAW